jgi:hypothetical protein
VGLAGRVTGTETDGISGAVSGSILAASLTRSALILPTRAPSIARFIRRMFCRLNTMKIATIKRTGTVSETVSESSR